MADATRHTRLSCTIMRHVTLLSAQVFVGCSHRCSSRRGRPCATLRDDQELIPCSIRVVMTRNRPRHRYLKTILFKAEIYVQCKSW